MREPSPSGVMDERCRPRWRGGLWVLGLMAVVLLGQGGRSACGATRVELVVDEPQPGRSMTWPVTTGVPFPRGGLKSAANCRLVDAAGKEQPLQVRAAAHWDAKRESIRWLTIDFLAQAGGKYALEFGDDVRRAEMPTSLQIERGDSTRVRTGALMVDFLPKGPAALGEICVDLNGDGRIDPAEKVAAGGKGGDHYYIDQKGQRFSSVNDGGDRQIVVESAGPVRACVRVDGCYRGPKGECIVRYRTRYHFFAGLSLVKLIDEFQIVGSTKETHFQDIGIALDLAEPTPHRRVTLDASGDEGSQPLQLDWHADTAAIASHQTTYRHYGNPEYAAGVVEVGPFGEKVHAQRDRVGEWLQVADGQGCVTGSLRWMWQQFPKEWEVTPRELVLHLWSPRAGALDFGADGLRKFFGPAGQKWLLEWNAHRQGVQSPIEKFFYSAGHQALSRGDVDGLGINKHHEIWLHFARPGESKQSAEYGQLAARQPLALATGEWNCSTDVFGPLLPRPNPSGYEGIIDRIFELSRYGQDAFGDYGWWLFGAGPHYSYQWDPATKRHYADSRRFEYHTYQKETQLWWCYLRSGERKFHDWAFPSENHWVDIAVSHVPTKYQSDWRGGERQEQTLHWPLGDWGIDSPLHYVRHHDTGEAWLRGASQYWASYHRTLETTSLAYYLSGDERYNDVINFWKTYWGDLAGKTSASTDVQPWHREQNWFRPTAAGEPPKTWARMIRDYAPFWSGSRHQQTLFFNLSTLYEHTWDPTLGQVLREYADAFLDEQHRIGIWRNQQNDLPAHADAPTLTHYWSSALWKYTRATQDPRMPGILKKWYDACYAADPFREDLGGYSAVHLGYAYYFTRDAKHLRPALLELQDLMVNALPLAKPEELGQRIYNPYMPVHALTATPRLAWALDRAQRDGVSMLPAPMKPQRSPIALFKPARTSLQATLWGYERELTLLGPDAKPYRGFTLKTTAHASEKQPFDRIVPNYTVYLSELTIPADAPAGLYVLSPKLELAVLQVSATSSVTWSAARPVLQSAEDTFSFRFPHDALELQIESASPASLRILGPDGRERSLALAGTVATIKLAAADRGQIGTIGVRGRVPVGWRWIGRPAAECWIAQDVQALAHVPSAELTAAVLPAESTFDKTATFVAGRFGRGLQIVPGRDLVIPDAVTVEGKQVRLSNQPQGTIEFWLRRAWDDRLVKPTPFPYLTNGALQVSVPWRIPLDEWAHVAVEWYPSPKFPEQTRTHVYVNGHDPGNYRNVYWDGYGDRPPGVATSRPWLEHFVVKAPPGTAFALDELRISDVPRYANREIDFGGRQTFNPVRFQPPTQQFSTDKQTLLLLRFDDDLRDEARRHPQVVGVRGELKEKK